MAYPNQYKRLQKLIETIITTAKLLGYTIDTHARKNNTRIRYTYYNGNTTTTIFHNEDNKIRVMRDGYTLVDLKYLPQRKKIKILTNLLQEL